jgi:hypothetical protein
MDAFAIRNVLHHSTSEKRSYKDQCGKSNAKEYCGQKIQDKCAHDNSLS